jgi:DNA-binding FadR family transcriptional regulator
MTVETCEALRRLARRLDLLPPEEFLRVGGHRQLHRAIRTASGEPAVALAHSAATEYAIDVIPYSVNVAAEGAKGEAWRITYDTAEALVAGDVASLFDCRRRMADMMRASWPQWSAIERDPRLAPKVTDASRPEFQLASNQAERLAREILREIRLKGWKAGERIGGGAELIARYGASTNILRQAVRMLQEHSAVEVERGRRGGLFVAVPDRARAVHKAQAFLERSRAAPSDVAAFLVHLTLEALEGEGPVSSEALRREIGGLADLSRLIAAAWKSPPLALFADILQPFLPRASQSSEAALAAFASGDRIQIRRAILAYAGPA